MVVTSLLATFVLLPNPFKDFGQSLIATTFFSSNILFWAESGYFDLDAHAKPLLHTWSLAVEEQFYIVFPLLLFACLRWFPAKLNVCLIFLSTAAFLLSVYAVANFESAAFYLAPARAWELLIGAALAVGVVGPIASRTLREILSLIGVGLIATAIFSFSDQTPFPGASAAVPCVGTALLIQTGKSGYSLVRRVLELRPLVFIGLMSYSLYLWHWPLLVIAQQYAIDAVPKAVTMGLVVLAFGLAAASWRWIEMPFRKKGSIEAKPLFVSAAVASGLAVTFGVWVHMSDGWPARLPGSAGYIAAFSESYDPRRPECLARASKWVDPGSSCIYGATVPPKYALWGDSHASAIIPELGRLASAHGQSVRFLGYEACPPVIGIRTRMDKSHRCIEYNDAVLEYLRRSSEIRTVFIIARHVTYISGRTGDFGPAEALESAPLARNSNGEFLDEEGRRELYAAGLGTSVDGLISAGKRVVLVYPIPETGYDIPTTLAKLALRGDDPELFVRPRRYFEQRNSFVFELLDHLSAKSGVAAVRPSERLCDDRSCKVMIDGQPLYFDDDHLSLAGAARISGLFDSFF